MLSSGSPLTGLLVFLVSLLIAVQYLRSFASSDPTSVFARPTSVFTQGYSTIRVAESDEYIAQVSKSDEPLVKASSDPYLCIAIATVQRDNARYFKTQIGSLVRGLAEAERKELYIVPFIGNTDPKQHRAYNETWLPKVVDKVETYAAGVPDADRKHYKTLEKGEGHRWKALYDYGHLLDLCYDTGAPYMLLLEDDVIAAEGWLHRTKAALDALEQRWNYKNALYLRLFYTHGFLGWNSENWKSYFFWSVSVEAFVAFVLHTIVNSRLSLARHLTFRTNFAILALYTPAFVGLYFMAGRLTVSPLPRGVHQMNEYGCCSQALVFPREKVMPLRHYLQDRGSGFRDTLIEDYANLHNLDRYALTPSIFQHIGTMSSKDPGLDPQSPSWNRSISAAIWNVDFERFDPQKLKHEHDAAVKSYLKSS